MNKRVIKVVATFDLGIPEYKGEHITPNETVKKIVEKDMISYFGMNEGYKGVEVEVIDE